VDRLLGGAGFEWYEISNWARPGGQSRHNLAYWRSLPHEAVGPGAHAFDGRARRWNAARLDAYLEALSPADGRQPSLPPGGTEVADPIATGAERAILRLRTRDGLDVPAAAEAAFAPAIAWGRAHGLLAEGPGGSVRLTMRGRLLANEVFTRLLPEPGGRAVVEAA
jgi:oxygen-independent coproporphyrinogen-3 oxidase